MVSSTPKLLLGAFAHAYPPRQICFDCNLLGAAALPFLTPTSAMCTDGKGKIAD